MSRNSKIKISVLLLLSFILGIKVGTFAQYKSDNTVFMASKVDVERNDSNKNLTSNEKRKLIYKKIEDLKVLINNIDNYYYKDIDIDKIFDNVYKSAFESLDPYSGYYNSEDVKKLETYVTGKFYGIGAVLSKLGDYPVITRVYKNSSSEKAGIMSGDKIIAVEGEDVKDLSLDDIVMKIRGDNGTYVNLTIEKINFDRVDIKVKRQEVNAETVEYKEINGNSVISISQFTAETPKQLKKVIDENKKNTAKGIIIDLRGNPGGMLSSVIEMCDMFLDEKLPIVTAQYKNNKSEKYYSKNKPIYTMPMIVLIDENSASASEIFAGNMKEHKRATIIGETSYGKGTVQSILKSIDGGEMKLTVAEYFVADNVKMNEVGVTPHIEKKSDFNEKYEKYEKFSKNYDIKLGKSNINVLALNQRLKYFGYDVDLSETMSSKTELAYKKFLKDNQIEYKELSNEMLAKVEALFLHKLLNENDNVLTFAIEELVKLNK